MNLFVYSDESGVFDREHNDYYVFGGLIFLSADERDECSRRYSAAEKNVRKSEHFSEKTEVKASSIKQKSRRKLYNVVKGSERFGVIVSQKLLTHKGLYSNRKTKQRYLDWVYKMSVRRKFEEMISRGIIEPDDIQSIVFMVDEHSTATDGLYELKESLEKEFKIGMWNFDYMTFHEPLFPKVKIVDLQYRNSSKTTLVRAADIVANHLFGIANRNDGTIPEEEKMNVFYHPNKPS
jgi:hypothetical protein